MRLLDTLIKKRDHHLALAGKFSDLIAVMEGDKDFAKYTHAQSVAIMEGALAVATSNGNGHTAPKSRPPRPPEWRAKQSAKMKKLWKEKRAVMLKGARKGNKHRMLTLKAKAKGRAATT